MTSYIPILNAEVNPDSPITESLATRWRDNPIAIIEGASGAPRATSRIITPGGAASDGTFVNGTTLTIPGYFDFASMLITANKTLPMVSNIRLDGNSSLSATLSARGRIATTPANSVTASAWSSLSGGDGTFASPSGCGGGGAVGNGSAGNGGGTAGAGGHIDNFSRYICLKRFVLGGYGGYFASTALAGGGSTFIFVHGDLDMTGGTIDCAGDDSYNGGATVNGPGGGGSIFIAVTGELKGGTFLARGGNGFNSGAQISGNGGGGYVCLMAGSYNGSQTIDVSAGTGGFSASQAGSSDTYTLTEAQINAMLLR